MRFLLLSLLLHSVYACFSQTDLTQPFRDCRLEGSITLYDYKKKEWIYSDTADAQRQLPPASTFKIINLLIALETGVINDENEIIQWPGQTDTTLYGYRPDIYHDMTVKEAFEVSAGWVFMILSQRIGKKQYRHYLQLAGYGNQDASADKTDFWNFGPLAISPGNQVSLLIQLYEEKLPFAKKHQQTVKRVMTTETTGTYTFHTKTGWGRLDNKNIGWWVGYVETGNNVYFFATRVTQDRDTPHPNFSKCRISITKEVLRQLKVL